MTAKIIKWLIQHLYTAHISWTPAFQSYYSAGDEAEAFCGECGEELEDESVENYCPRCGRYLIWHKQHKEVKKNETW